MNIKPLVVIDNSVIYIYHEGKWGINLAIDFLFYLKMGQIDF